MKNLKWIKEEQKYFLKSDDASLIKLNITSATFADFILNEKQFVIRKKGAWNPAYYVAENGTEIIKLTHSFWGSRGKIICWDDTAYKCEYLNNDGLKVRFLDGENELLSYSLSLESKQQIINFNIGTTMEDAEKLLQLAALGMVMFNSLVGENYSNQNDNLSLLLFAAAS